MSTPTYTLENIIGQDKAKKMLRRSLESESMGHAYLFRGPAGVGKKRGARTFAALLNCLAPIDGDACSTCVACRKLQAGSHPDLLVIEPEKGTIKIKQIRELKKSLRFPAMEGRRRVVILPDIHSTLRRKEAANSLLKTLEEPPEDTLLILTADETGDVLPTILSRCQMIPFHSLPHASLTGYLVDQHDIMQDQAAILATIAEGSLGQAAFLFESGLLAERAHIAEVLCRKKANDPAAAATILAMAEKAAGLKDDLEELLRLLAIWYRDLILLKTGVDGRFRVNHDLDFLLPEASKRWQLPKLIRNLDHLQEARRQLGYNCRPALVCEVLFFALL